MREGAWHVNLFQSTPTRKFELESKEEGREDWRTWSYLTLSKLGGREGPLGNHGAVVGAGVVQPLRTASQRGRRKKKQQSS